MNFNEKIETIKRDLIRTYIAFLSIVFVFYFILFYFYLNKNSLDIYLIIGLVSILIFYSVLPLKYNVKIISHIYFVCINLYLGVYIFLLSKNMMSFMYLSLLISLPYGAYILISKRWAIFYLIYTIIVQFLAIRFSLLFHPKVQYSEIDYVIIFDLPLFLFSLLSFVLLFYYHFKILNLKETTNKNINANTLPINTSIHQHELLDHEKLKYNELFTKLLYYIKERESFKIKDLSSSKIATDLNTNSTYISKAISLNGYKNINQLLNKYRIEFVIEKIKTKELDKYTLFRIYDEAGFKHQSTFNKAFKDVTGETPSEFIHKLKEVKL